MKPAENAPSSPAALANLVRTHGHCFLSTEDGAFWVWNAPAMEIMRAVDQWTFPRLSALVQLRQLQDKTLTVYTLLQRQTVPAVAILFPLDRWRAELLSFWVHPQRRRAGIGNLLLNQIDLLCLKSGVRQMFLHYRTYWPMTTVWRRMLDRRGWKESATLMHYVIVSDWDRIYASPWYQRVYLPTTFKIESATPQKLAALVRSWEDAGQMESVPTSLHPAQLVQRLDQQASLIALSDGEPVGWCLLHQLRDDLWQCTTVYVQPDHRSRLGLGLVAEMVRRHAGRGRIHFMIQPENQLMLRFAHRHLKPAGAELHRLLRMEHLRSEER